MSRAAAVAPAAAGDPSVAIRPEGADPAAVPSDAAAAGDRFVVSLDVFQGPFEVLLQLITARQLDVTQLALAKVTDDFIAFIRRHGKDWELDQASEFLVIAATLLDLKAARLLPAADVEDEEDIALLEAGDLLFARLLQYRAYKALSAVLAELFEHEARFVPRTAGLDPQLAGAVPDVELGLSPGQFARLAAMAMQPRATPVVAVDHVHAPAVNVREQAAILTDRLRLQGSASFRALCRDAESTLIVVGRFLAVLELFRDGVVAFEQAAALGELFVRWVGQRPEPTGGEPRDPADLRAAPEQRIEAGPGDRHERPGT